jgi:putative redox protein
MSDRASLTLATVAGDGLRFDVQAEKFTMTFDSGPHAQAASPVQAVLAAIGGCAGMDVISILRKKRQDVTGYSIELEADRAAEHPRVFIRVTVVHRLTGRGLSEKAVADAIRLSEDKYCPVHAMLNTTVAIESRFEIVPAG